MSVQCTIMSDADDGHHDACTPDDTVDRASLLVISEECRESERRTIEHVESNQETNVSVLQSNDIFSRTGSKSVYMKIDKGKSFLIKLDNKCQIVHGPAVIKFTSTDGSVPNVLPKKRQSTETHVFHENDKFLKEQLRPDYLPLEYSGTRIELDECSSVQTESGPTSPCSSHDSDLPVVPQPNRRIRRAVKMVEMTEYDQRNKDKCFVQNIIKLLSTIKRPKVTNVDRTEAYVTWVGVEFKPGIIKSSKVTYLLKLYMEDELLEQISCGVKSNHHLKNLQSAQEYGVSVIARVDSHEGSATERVNFTTKFSSTAIPRLSHRTENSLHFDWSHLKPTGQYLLQYSLTRDSRLIDAYRGTQKSFIVKHLNPDCPYFVKLSHLESHECSESTPFTTLGLPPSTPGSVRLIKREQTSLTVGWDQLPQEEVSYYILRIADSSESDFNIIYEGTDSQFTSNGLRSGTSYSFIVSADNQHGSSETSKCSTFCTLPPLPNTPQELRDEHIGSNCCTLSWDKSTCEGGEDCELQYIVERNYQDSATPDFEEMFEGSECEATISGLFPGCEYTFRVIASNETGKSPPSKPLIIKTYPVAPSQCRPPQISNKPRPSFVHLVWDIPDYDGGSSILEYSVQMTTSENIVKEIYRGVKSECIVFGLTPGSYYWFRIQAHNIAGSGPLSNELQVRAALAPPAVPSPPKVIFKSPTIAHISWKPPHDNGSPITEYQLECLVNGTVYAPIYNGPKTYFEAKQLLPASFYHFRIKACNSMGWSHVSSAVCLSSPPSCPAAVQSVTASDITSTSFFLDWTRPDNCGAEISHYSIEIGDGNLSISYTTSYAALNLHPETTYKARVQAVNSYGAGVFSPWTKITTLCLAPDPPVIECVAVSSSSIKLKWTDTRAARHNLLLVDPNGRATSIYNGSHSSFKVIKLAEKTSYTFRVYSSNDAGDGDCSDDVTFTTTKALPALVKGLRLRSVADTSVAISWQEHPPINGDRVTYYAQISDAFGGEFRRDCKCTDVKHEFSGLFPDTDYRLRVSAIRHCDDGAHLSGSFTSFLIFKTEPTHAEILDANMSLKQKQSLFSQIWSNIRISDKHIAIFILFIVCLMGFLFAYVVQTFYS